MFSNNTLLTAYMKLCRLACNIIASILCTKTVNFYFLQILYCTPLQLEIKLKLKLVFNLIICFIMAPLLLGWYSFSLTVHSSGKWLAHSTSSQ